MSSAERFGKPVTENRLRTIEQVVHNRQLDLTLVLENIHNPHNVGAIFRTADAVGIDELHLLYTAEKLPWLHPKVTASGAKWVKLRSYTDPRILVDALHQRGFTLYSTQLSQNALSIHEVDWTKPSAIVLGNENRGVSQHLAEMADHNIMIPMFGMVQCLNVSVATAIILFEACRQRLAAGKYPNGELGAAWIDGTIESWVHINKRNHKQKSKHKPLLTGEQQATLKQTQTGGILLLSEIQENQ